MKPSELVESLTALIKKQRPGFIWGSPGIGKSELVAQLAEDLKLELRDVRLSMMDPIDLKGFPVVDTAKKHMKWLPADFLPTKGKGILFLDELNTALPAVQAGGYQLTLNRRVGEYELPPGWVVMAAGNRGTDRAVVHTMPSPLANRFVHLDLEADPDDWGVWAMGKGIHDHVRAFMKLRPELLNKFDPQENPRAFPTPRSWSFVDEIYQDRQSPSVQRGLIAGAVGEAAAAEFLGFVRLIKDMPSVDEVLLNPDTTEVPKISAGQYAIATALDSKTTATNMARVMTYVTRMPIEFQVVYIRSVLRRNSTLAKTKTFIDWQTVNQDVLT